MSVKIICICSSRIILIQVGTLALIQNCYRQIPFSIILMLQDRQLSVATGMAVLGCPSVLPILLKTISQEHLEGVSSNLVKNVQLDTRMN